MGGEEASVKGEGEVVEMREGGGRKWVERGLCSRRRETYIIYAEGLWSGRSMYREEGEFRKGKIFNYLRDYT